MFGVQLKIQGSDIQTLDYGLPFTGFRISILCMLGFQTLGFGIPYIGFVKLLNQMDRLWRNKA